MGLGVSLGKNYSTFAIAQMLHVDPGSVANWIDQGLLKAYRTPGGHRRVTAGNLLCFLKNHDMPIPPTMVTGRRIRIMIVDEPRVSNRIANAIKKAHPDYDVTEVSDAFMAGAVAATQTDVSWTCDTAVDWSRRLQMGRISPWKAGFC